LDKGDKARAMTQSKNAAKQMDINPSTLSNYERNLAVPPTHILETIKVFLTNITSNVCCLRELQPIITFIYYVTMVIFEKEERLN